MGRVSQESLDKLNAFLDSIPAEARGKCAMCTETLTHIVKTAEVESGAGTATVTRALADRINETAAPQDRVTGDQLRDRVRNKVTERNLSGRNAQIDSPEDKKEEKPEVKPAAAKTARRPEMSEERKYIQAIDTVSDEFEKAERLMFDAILNAKHEGWITTTKIAVIKRLESLALLIN